MQHGNLLTHGFRKVALTPLAKIKVNSLHTPLTISLSVTPARLVLLHPAMAAWTAAVEGLVAPGVSVATALDVVALGRSGAATGEERESLKREKTGRANRKDFILSVVIRFCLGR